MLRVREHIYGLHGNNLVLLAKQLQVACLAGRIAADVDDALGLCIQDYLHHIGVHTCAGRVGDDDIGAPVSANEIVGKDILHVACVEQRVRQAVERGVLLSIFNSFGYILDADDLPHERATKLAIVPVPV